MDPLQRILSSLNYKPLINHLKAALDFKKSLPDFHPTVTVIQNECNTHYPSNLFFHLGCFLDLATKFGVQANIIRLPKGCSNYQILDVIKKCNSDPNVHGIFAELAENSETLIEAIYSNKDITGLKQQSLKNVQINFDAYLLPCVATTIWEHIKKLGHSLEKRKVIILEDKNITFGILKPLLSENAIVTISHSKTEELSTEIKSADIVIVARKENNNVKKLIKPGALLLECFPSESILVDTSIPFDYISWEQHLKTSALVAIINVLTAAKKQINFQWNLSVIPLNTGPPGLSDIQIARSQIMKDITVLAQEIGLHPHEIELYGEKKAKVSLSVLEKCKYRSPGKYIVVSGVTPTPLGEGKSTTTVGLCQALAAQLKKNVIACVRQPSQGPTFGIKGGAAGGGYSQVVPMEDFNLHLTGDIHAVTAANNLLAAQIDTRIFHEATQKDADLYKRLVKSVKGKKEFSKIQLNRLQRLGITKTDPDTLTSEEISRFVRLDIDPASVTWHRVLDVNDRFLRKIIIGLSPTEKNMTRETQFDISVASEIMAILALTTDMNDMKQRLSRIVVANDKKGNPVTAEDLGITGALAVLMKDTLLPNLMQTLEGAPVFVHAGPFANIAHGNSSIIADKMALKLVGEHGFVVTEAGFGADIGLEKFCNIKCRYSGLTPNAAVIVATIRALKLHGGGPNITAGVSLPKEYIEENLELVQKGYCNLQKHIKIAKKFGLPVVVALNQFHSDTDAELMLVKTLAEEDGVSACVVCTHFSKGSQGAKMLAEAVIEASNIPVDFKYLYDLKASIREKIETIAKEIYGADGVEYSEHSSHMIELFEKQGYGELPVCMAKTPLSLSHDKNKKGVPVNFTVPIHDIKLSAGAGFVYPLLGDIPTIPGLPTRPCFYDMDIDAESGDIEGLF